MGLTVVGLGLLDIAIWFVVLNYFDQDGLISITTTMLTFGMGASTQALFARVGGGIYTKAADVGADLVGKVEANIPEDDPRNPATIADNVGDNVGDVAGMGADLYESYCGSILSTAALGATAYAYSAGDMQLRAVIAPMLIAAVGVFLSLLGVFLVKRRTERRGLCEHEPVSPAILPLCTALVAQPYLAYIVMRLGPILAPSPKTPLLGLRRQRLYHLRTR
jgi:K(+)-stimulated pyrophosphate-energized sodium pump